MGNKLQLILLGAPGAGKGTQATNLVSKLGYKHISTGDLLRTEVSSESDLGNRVKKIMEEGNLVDDETVLELLKSQCDLKNNKYIFDGFPRNIAQAISLDEIVLKNDIKSKAIYFNLDLTVLTQRLVNRRTCSKCGEIYNLSFKAPKVENVCDICSGELTQRKDDNEETVKTRLGVFEEAINPLLDYYGEKNRLIKVDADQKPNEVFSQLEKLL